MLTMYVKTGCPYCALAIGKVDDLDLKVEYKNIADDAVAAELVERGGKRTVPYLVDEERSVEMYDSSNIVDYLNKNYAGKDSTDG